MQTTGDFSKLHPAPFPIAAHCGPDGAFVDNVPLLRAVDDPAAGRIWAPRQQAALNLDLGSGYCLDVDTRRLADDLCIVAGALNKGNIQAARVILAAIGLPAFPQRLHGRLDGRAQGRLAKILRELSLLKQSDDEPSGGESEYEQPRQPKGSPGGIGGQYAPKTGATAEASTPVKGRLSPVVRQALKGILQVAKKYGWEVAVPGGLIIDALLQVLTPSELDPNEEAAVQHWMAEHDYAGGKTLAEIQAHPGGPGYQEHHFLENTQENQANIPEGFRDAPENKGKIPTLSHEQLHTEMSTKDSKLDDMTLRDSMRGKPVEEQLETMFKLMRKLRILK